MTIEQLGNPGDFVGGVAVIATLLYLTIQIRKQTNEVRLTATRDLAHDGELADIYRRGLRDYESLGDLERMRLNMYLHAVFRIYEQAFLHTNQTGVDDRYFASTELTKEDLLGYPGVQSWWRCSGTKKTLSAENGAKLMTGQTAVFRPS